MTRWLTAARQAQQSGTQLTQLTKPQSSDVSSVMSVLSGAESEKVGLCDAAPKDSDQFKKEDAHRFIAPETGFKSSPTSRSEHDHKKRVVSVGGRLRTWTGRVVSLEDWRQLSAWDKEGGKGRAWDGLTRNWDDVE